MPALVSRSVVWYCSLANLINAADRVVMPITIIQMAAEFSWPLHQQGWVLSAFSIGYLSSQIFGARAARRFGGKRTLAMAVFLWSLSTFLTPLLGSFLPLLIIIRVLLGIGEGIGLPAIFHIFSNTVATEERSRAVAYMVAFGSVGHTIATLICPHLPWRLSFYGFGFLGMAWVAWWSVFYKDNAPPPDMPSEVDILHKRGSSVRWLDYFAHWPLWAIYIAHASMNWSNYVMMNWLPTYLALSLKADSHTLMLTALPYIGNSIFGVAAGHYSDFLITYRKWTVLSVRRLMTFIGLVVPGLLLAIFGFVRSIPTAVVLVSLMMSFSACNSAGHLSNHAEVAPNHAAVTFAISNTLATIPGVLSGPLTASLVASSQGRWLPVFLLASAISLTGGIVFTSQSAASQVL